MEIVAPVSALLSALGPYVLELGRRPDADEQIDAVAAALLELEGRLAAWAVDAAQTNAEVREWVEALPESAEGEGPEFESQRVAMGEVSDFLRSGAGLPPAPRLRRKKETQADLEGLLRVHVPEPGLFENHPRSASSWPM